MQPIESRRSLEDLTAVLYPDDSNERGKKTRLMQEYSLSQQAFKVLFATI